MIHDELRKEFDDWTLDLWKNREMSGPNIREEDIQNLPNILQVIEAVEKTERAFAYKGGWMSVNKKDLFLGPIFSDQNLSNPHIAFCNNEEENTFIINRLMSGRYSLKPNLRTHPFLFRGQREHYPTIQSSYAREKLNSHLISNLRAEEFILKLKRHPIFMMFDRGIFLEGLNETLFLEMNYYGLAQHYNFNTGLVDFTSDILAAAFFATTINGGEDKYEPFGGDDKNKIGVIYLYQIDPSFSFLPGGFRSIGQQVYPRSGAQHGFFFQEEASNIPLEKQVIPIFFRHDPECAQQIFERLNKGKLLFPEDDLSKIAKDIVSSNTISGETFTHNLYTNHDNLEKNLEILKDHSIEIDWHKIPHFALNTTLMNREAIHQVRL